MIAYKRIVKNTMSLYLRQLFSMFVSLYITRLILRILGASDFGLYNVIGGIIPLFAFFASAMTSATQRYIAVDLGRGDVGRLKLTFSTITYIYWILSAIIIVIAETIGLWYLNYKMVIPEDRLFIANIVYQISVLSCIISVVSTPYSAAIVAHERLDIYAYIGILETVLRLALALLLFFAPMLDNLLAYSIGIFCVSLTSRLIYGLYCRKHFVECTLVRRFDRRLYKDVLSYTSYNMMGNLAIVGKNQGVNLLMNLFFGSVVNAAQGIAMQVVNVINSFVSNVYMSTRPQIIKLYSTENWDEAWNLLALSTRYSFYLILVIVVPVILGVDGVLRLWLGEYPEFTAIFIKLILLDVLVQSSSNQLITLLQAANRIKRYQLISSIVLLMILPVSYLLYRMGLPPYSVYVVAVLFSVISSFIIVCVVKKEIICFQVEAYLRDILFPVLKVIVPVSALTLLMLEMSGNTWVEALVGCVISCLVICFVGIGKKEKEYIISIMKRKF